MKSLDSIFEKCTATINDPRIFLKMDTQGYDLKVLAGASKHIDQILGLQSEVAVIETYDGMKKYLESIPKMNQMGFELTGLFPVGRDKKLRVIEFDCVMVRGNGK